MTSPTGGTTPSTPGGDGMVGQPLGQGEDRGVGVGVAGDAEQEVDVAVLGQRRQQPVLEGSEPLGQVDDDPGQAGRQVGGGPLGGSGEEVALVVPLPGQQPGDLGGDPRRLVAPGRAGQRGERPRAGDAQLAVEVAQGDDGRRVVVDAGVQPRACRG